VMVLGPVDPNKYQQCHSPWTSSLSLLESKEEAASTAASSWTALEARHPSSPTVIPAGRGTVFTRSCNNSAATSAHLPAGLGTSLPNNNQPIRPHQLRPATLASGQGRDRTADLTIFSRLWGVCSDACKRIHAGQASAVVHVDARRCGL
jgi:hypothetical protein